MAAGDFNGDGVKEVFIGAPGYSTPGMQERGAVYLTDLNLAKKIDFTKPYLQLNEVYARFGYSVVALDINHDGIDDLAVSAPA
jgi:glycosylphosphatidylinositol phospholipase D